MKGIFLNVLDASLYGSIVILVVLLLRLVLKKAPKSVFCLLWFMAGVRLMLPFEIESSFSLQPRLEPAALNQTVEAPVQVPDSMVPVLNGNAAQPDALSAAGKEITGGYENMESTSYLYAVKDGEIRLLTLGDFAAWIWTAGVLVLGIYSLWSYRRLKKQVHEAVVQPDGWWECGSIGTAFVLGFLPPRIYLPTGLSGEDRELILAHEKTHIARKDHWIKSVGFAVLAIHWFNPLVWVAYGLLCRDIEMACDEQVVKTMDLPTRKAYS